mmetsp:Transcript_2937/g.7932  ORF Transcript_2937/g.7932 Transcript_2937/m.7932 type:complete len:410 (-) Transcript_2937:1523-2752(-)
MCKPGKLIQQLVAQFSNLLGTCSAQPVGYIVLPSSACSSFDSNTSRLLPKISRAGPYNVFGTSEPVLRYPLFLGNNVLLPGRESQHACPSATSHAILKLEGFGDLSGEFEAVISVSSRKQGNKKSATFEATVCITQGRSSFVQCFSGPTPGALPLSNQSAIPLESGDTLLLGDVEARVFFPVDGGRTEAAACSKLTAPKAQPPTMCCDNFGQQPPQPSSSRHSQASVASSWEACCYQPIYKTLHSTHGTSTGEPPDVDTPINDSAFHSAPLALDEHGELVDGSAGTARPHCGGLPSAMSLPDAPMSMGPTSMGGTGQAVTVSKNGEDLPCVRTWCRSSRAMHADPMAEKAMNARGGQWHGALMARRALHMSYTSNRPNTPVIAAARRRSSATCATQHAHREEMPPFLQW